MKKLNNKGFNLVEICISILVFTILMTPIITQIITTSRANMNAKKEQNITEVMEDTMEHFKQNDFDQLDSLSTSTEEFENLYNTTYKVNTSGAYSEASTSVTSTEYTTEAGDIMADEKVYAKLINVGVDDQLFWCVVSMDTVDYAVRQQIEDGNSSISSEEKYKDPNSIAIQNFDTIDSSKDAVLSSDINKYDIISKNAILATKTAILREEADAEIAANEANNTSNVLKQNQYKNLIKGDNTFWQDDNNYSKVTTVYISYDEYSSKYSVKVTATYNTTYLGSNSYSNRIKQTYTVYSKTYDEKPDIYAMYHQYVMGNAIVSDTIVFDNSGLFESDGSAKNTVDGAECRVHLIKLDSSYTVVDASGNETVIETSKAYNDNYPVYFNMQDSISQSKKITIYTDIDNYKCDPKAAITGNGLIIKNLEDDVSNNKLELYKITVELYDGSLSKSDLKTGIVNGSLSPAVSLTSGKEDK